jgi:nucleoid-associated protein YgaU
VDQNLSGGNRGYLQGQAPLSEETKERKTTRTTRVVEIELHSPLKFEKRAKARPQKEAQRTAGDSEMMGNRGYITQSVSPEIAEPQAQSFENYKVQKGDTLQKISQKFYGTSRKWKKIFDANQNVLKSPDKVYPGQEIRIPMEALREPQENLK